MAWHYSNFIGEVKWQKAKKDKLLRSATWLKGLWQDPGVPCIMDGANRALQVEAARVFAQSEEKTHERRRKLAYRSEGW